jgi:hypothetical protein
MHSVVSVGDAGSLQGKARRTPGRRNPRHSVAYEIGGRFAFERALRLAPMRFVPFSYFCTCWNVRPSALPSSVWLIASNFRRIRTRPPTCVSTGFGALVTVIGLHHSIWGSVSRRPSDSKPRAKDNHHCSKTRKSDFVSGLVAASALRRASAAER